MLLNAVCFLALLFSLLTLGPPLNSVCRAFTFPTNQATANWTVRPENRQELRNNWEYSHAAGALLDLIVFVALILPRLSIAAAHLPRSKGDHLSHQSTSQEVKK